MNVNFSVVRLMPDDFKAFTKIKIDNQSFNKDNMPSHFKVSWPAHDLYRSLSTVRF